MQKLHLLILVFSFSFLQLKVFSLNHNPYYHMGPVLTSPINLYIIWYGQQWNSTHQSTIRDFITSLSSPPNKTNHPSVSDWWHTVTLYTNKTGSNITSTINLSNEFHDLLYSQGKNLTRLSMQSVVKHAVTFPNSTLALPLDPTNGVYLILTSGEVTVQEFCRAVCGFHSFTKRGTRVPYAWVGYSGTQCPGYCDFPFQNTKYGPKGILGAPNRDPATDGMISVIGHELAEVSTDPFTTGWYGGDRMAPNEVADVCMGVYGEGGGGGYVGKVYTDKMGNGYNLNGVNKRKFLEQWVWNPVTKSISNRGGLGRFVNPNLPMWLL